MIRLFLSSLFPCVVLAPLMFAETASYERDTIKTGAGDVVVTFIGHGTLVIGWKDKTIHVDPYGKVADYQALPPADLILVTHHHGDHLDPGAIESVGNDKTKIILTEKCAETMKKGIIMKNGDVQHVLGITVEAVPAYNLVHKRPDGSPFHPKGEGNGYVLTIGKTRIYIAGDTENTPEMKSLKDIDVAFLPMNLPYTMTPEMVADAAMAFKPKVLYPYHYGKTDPSRLVDLLKGTKGIEIRIRKME